MRMFSSSPRQIALPAPRTWRATTRALLQFDVLFGKAMFQTVDDVMPGLRPFRRASPVLDVQGGLVGGESVGIDAGNRIFLNATSRGDHVEYGPLDQAEIDIVAHRDRQVLASLRFAAVIDDRGIPKRRVRGEKV